VTRTLPKVSLEQLKRVMVTLEPGRLAYLVQGFLKVRRNEWSDLGLACQLQLLLCDWMAHLGFVSDQQQNAILTEVRRDLLTWKAFFSVEFEQARPISAFTLTISDGRYVLVTGRNAWFDLQTETAIERLPDPCVTHIVCDVPALYLRTLKRLAYLGGVKDEPLADRPAAASPGPADPA
jgi:hypothetical protein